MRVRALFALPVLLLPLLAPKPSAPPPAPAPAAPYSYSGPVIDERADLERAIRAAQVAQQEQAAAKPPAPKTSVRVSRIAYSPPVYGSGACGGDLPPCSVMMCESGGSLTAQNPHSTASGKWQILDSTWAGYDGYARAMDAPESVQDDKARLIYAGGAGRRAWSC